MQASSISPRDVVMGATSEQRTVSPEAADVIQRIKDYYKQQGKAAAATNYARHLKLFFGWAEAQGYTLRNLPSDAVETFLSSLAAAGQKETTLYVMRTQLKAALREANTLLGLDVGHLEYMTGKPPAVRQAQKAKEKQKRGEQKTQTILAQAAAIQAAQQVLGYQTSTPAAPPPPVEDTVMSEPTTPAPSGAPATGASNPMQPTVIVVPQAAGANPAGSRATIANPAVTRPAQPTAAQPARGVVINNHTFTGAFVKISYVSDGSNPFTPPGTETYITTLPASQLAPHGDLGAFLQSYVVPSMRLAPTTSQVQFVFHELNDRRQPTGRRDELVVGIPLNLGAGAPPPALNGIPGIGFGPSAPTGPTDSATTFLLKKLDEDAAEAKKRAEEYQTQLREAKDAQQVFMLTQMHQREQDLRKELEEQRARLTAAPAPVPVASPPMPLFPPMPFLPPEPPKPDTSMADMVKAMSENQAKMMEVMLTASKPVPPPPQKDTAEWLVPFISQMNQQAQAQAQANQQMLMTVMQANQSFMQAMLTRENPVEKMLLMQLQEVKAVAAAPKADAVEEFAEKLQKFRAVSDMMGGGGGGSLLTELLANADTIGAGAARIIDAAKGNSTTINGPTQAVAQEQKQLAGAPATPKLPAGTNGEFPPPPEAVMAAHKNLAAAVEKRGDEETAQAFVLFLREMVTAQEPYASMGRRLMTAFQQAEDEGELYTLAKNLWIVVGEKPERPQAKYAARVIAEFYSALHQTIFDEPRTLPEDEEAAEGEKAETDSDEKDEDAGSAEVA